MRFRRALPLILLVAQACARTPESAKQPPAPVRPAAVVTPVGVSAAMLTKVTVIITGLNTIGDLQTAPVPGELMPKMLFVRNVRSANHLPTIMVRNVYKPTSDRSTTSTTNKVFTLVELDGDPLTFVEADPSTNKLTYTDTPPANGPCPTSSEEASLYFFPRISRVVPAADHGNRRLDSSDLDCEYVNPQPGSTKVAGWIRMSYGTIRAKLLNQIIWEFKDSASSSTHQQISAQEAHWTFEIPGTKLTLQSSNPKAPNKVLQMEASNGEITLTFINAPLTSIEELADGAGTGQHDAEDPHFKHYYDSFTPYQNANLPRYFPKALNVCSGGQPSKDPCDLFHAINNATNPGGCPEPYLSGAVNCGPDGQP